MIQIFSTTPSFDFMGKRFYFLGLSGVLLLISLGLIFGKGFVWGIDFAGGVEFQIALDEPVPIEEVRKVVEALPVKDVSVQSYGEAQGKAYLVRVGKASAMEEQKILQMTREALKEAFSSQGIRFLRQDLVGPKVGKELRRKGFLSILFAMLGILVYIALRFEFRYGLGAFLTLFHDPIIILGMFSLLEKEMNLQIVAAILTIVGYSVNDTVVVFDRIREERRKSPRDPFVDVLNRAINLTLSRTVLTSLTTLFTMLALFFLTPPGSVIHDFAFAMIGGIVVGTYSSIYIASPVVLYLEKRPRRR